MKRPVELTGLVWILKPDACLRVLYVDVAIALKSCQFEYSIFNLCLARHGAGGH